MIYEFGVHEHISGSVAFLLDLSSIVTATIANESHLASGIVLLMKDVSKVP